MDEFRRAPVHAPARASRQHNVAHRPSKASGVSNAELPYEYVADKGSALQNIRWPIPRTLLIITGAVVVGAIVAAILLLAHLHKTKVSVGGLPASVIRQISGFTPYVYISQGPIDSFQLTQNSAHYQDGVLIFQLANNAGKTLAVTEQRLPSNYGYQDLVADKEFDTPSGKAFITDAVTRTTGALFTSDKTWILINAPSPIGANAMTTVLSSFVKQ